MARETTESSFDELAIGLSSGTLSRGKALKLMGAALLGGSLASLGIREAGADPPGCKRKGKSCKNDEQCCSGICEGETCVCIPFCEPCTENRQCCSGVCDTERTGVCSGQGCF
jgi:hypothetical protein